MVRDNMVKVTVVFDKDEFLDDQNLYSSHSVAMSFRLWFRFCMDKGEVT